MIFKDIDLFDISNQATINIIENNIYLDLSNVKANGHRLNIDNRLVECVRLSSDTIASLNEWMEIINKLEISFDNIEWIEISNKNFILDKSNRIEINLNEKYKIKFIKLNIKDENYINKIKIEILNRKFPGLMVASRSDGFGARFMPILNAMYLSNKLGYKFGIVWPKSSYDQTSLKKLDNNELAGLYGGNEEFIFDKEFLNLYSYLGKISPANIPAENHDIQDYLKRPHQENFGYHISYDISKLNGLDKYYLREYPKLWKSIKFTKPVNDIIDNVNQKVQKYFPNKFIAIHIRAGDGVYDYIRSGLDAFYRKMMPNEIAMALIDENLKINNDIVLFGDDFTQLRELKKFYKNKIYLIEDFIDDTIIDIKRVIFDIVFMSKAKEIYSGGSSFAKTASYIGLGKIPKYYFTHFSIDEMIIIIKKYFNYNLNLHQYQKSYSLLFLHNLCLMQHISRDELISILNQGINYDRNNCAFLVHMFNHYMYLKKYDEANNTLGLLFDLKDFDWMYKYIIKHKDSIYKVFVNNIIGYSQEKYLNISYMAAKISIDTKLTRSRVLKYIQNYLLGLEINDGSKYLLNHYINIAEKLNISINQLNSQIETTTKNDSYLKSELENEKIALKKQIDINRSNEILLQNIKSENQKLQKLNTDLSLAYNAAKSNAKNYLSYKLGQALIKASKNWYKGGYIKFIFEAIKITKEHKKRCK
ncbi:O-fucosyltransferase family protein [Campylobacter hyointestinalis]|uniref:Sugar transferase n=1 Tax=Campylobacter hyointestinalis subsp. lawsonii TaxID=91353 RepID=A0AAV6EDC5_CAMHY|nr:hypothetical protein [Campylobacter hyointestinalis]KAB0610753.1 hypothetical protein F7P66_09135 [Campylobacter hyointestinalis subsp. lawsonii]QKF69756.1 hypothetical protein CHLWT_1201 [Campylobacter hyointestinalis subsp. lawsonii]RAZ27211.1 hypothetical protein CHLT_08825 [Campylobacter hyointestinalis subsp. lawsonii]